MSGGRYWIVGQPNGEPDAPAGGPRYLMPPCDAEKVQAPRGYSDRPMGTAKFGLLERDAAIFGTRRAAEDALCRLTENFGVTYAIEPCPDDAIR